MERLTRMAGTEWVRGLKGGEMATTLYATFSDIDSAERAAGALLDYGVRPEDLSLVRKEDGEPATPLGADAPAPYVAGQSRADNQTYDNLAARDEYYDPERAAKSGMTSTTPEDAGEGAVKGAEVGLGVGALAALAAIFVPGFGLIAGGGALAIAIGGAVGATGAGAIAGAVTGYLKDQGMESPVAEHLGTTLAGGGSLLSLSVPSGPVDESTARSILDKYAATQVTNYGSTGSGGYIA